jgi:hypothetical protein
MVPVTVVDELLLTVLAALHRGAEVPDPRGLECRTERAECGIYVPGFLPHRAVIYAIDELHGIATGKRGTGRMGRFAEDEHAETSEQEF